MATILQVMYKSVLCLLINSLQMIQMVSTNETQDYGSL